MTEIKIINCNKCKIELKQSDHYYIFEFSQHVPNVSFSPRDEKKHLCKDCWSKLYF